MIKYKYAYNSEGLIDIEDIDRDNRSVYTCISCNKELIPKLGKKNKHHFAHKHIDVFCNSETYLHILAKKTFMNIFNKCIYEKQPFYIELEQNEICTHYESVLKQTCEFIIPKKYDLTYYFDEAIEETYEENYKPDIMLLNKKSNKKLFIEFVVTHYSSEEKKNSKYRIIEIKIDDENDITNLYNRILTPANAKISFLNFNTKLKGDYCNGNCKKEYIYVTLDSTGRVMLRSGWNLKKISNYCSNNCIKKSLIYDDTQSFSDYGILSDYGTIFKKFVASCAKEKLFVKNCFIYRYHAKNNWDEECISGMPIFCKYFKKQNNSNVAVDCEIYKREIKYIDELLEL
jgi:hypothetical protein